MQNWCFIEAGAVVLGPSYSPQSWRNVSNVHTLSDPDLFALGWRKHRLIPHPVGAVFTGSDWQITDTEAIETQTSRDMTFEEIAEQERAGVPAEVALWRLRVIFRMAGEMSRVEAAIAALPDPQRAIAHEAWEYGNTVERNHPLVTLVAAACALDDRGVDDRFRRAEALSI